MGKNMAPMRFHLYLVTDRTGCSPMLTTRPLPWRALREADPGFLVRPQGSYARLNCALERFAETLAVEDELRTEGAWPATQPITAQRLRRP